MNINNQEIFEKALKTLNDNDRKTLEAFAHFLLVSSNSSLSTASAASTFATTVQTNLLDKANDVLLKDYISMPVSVNWDLDEDNIINPSFIRFTFSGRDKVLTFPTEWLVVGNLNAMVKSVYVKFRPGSNRIDKIALDSAYLTKLGKTEGKKRILALNSGNVQQNVVIPPAFTTNQPVSSSNFVQKIIAASSDGWTNTSATAQISVPKNDPMFAKLDSFKEGRLRLSRVGEVLFNALDKTNCNEYVWDSEFFFGSPHDFTNIKTNKTYDIKCHFHSGERLQLSQQTLNKCDADFIVAVLVEEDSVSYTATVVGYITKADFTAKTKPWAYNEYVDLRSLELHELNSPKDLFY